MKYVALSAMKAKLSTFVDEVRIDGEPIVIQKHEKDAAVLIKMDQFLRWREMEDLVTSLQLKEALKGRRYKLREVLRELGRQV